MSRRLLVLACALLLIPVPAAASGVSQSSALVGVQQVLYRGGTNGYGCFRIPVLARTAAGTLLAFAEARKSPTCADRGDIDLVVRRSTNDGRTWGPIRVVTSGSPTDPDDPYTRGNAVPVMDTETGKINLITTSNEATLTGKRLPWIQQSPDDGLTWATPRPLGASFDGTNNGWFATGPAHGIQLEKGPHKGRLIVGAHQKPNSTTVLAGVLYSDDNGDTWHASQVPNSYVEDQLSPGEIAVAELPDGALYAAARNEITTGHHRAKAISTDSGTTMPAFSAIPSLVSPNVQGSVLPLKRTYRSTPGDVLVFSGPSDPDDREKLRIRYSLDRGTTWSNASNGLVTNERSGYSDLAELTGGEIGVLYEGGVSFSADEIRFTRFTPGQLGLPGTTRGTPSPQPSTPAGPTTPDSTPEANDAYLRGNASLNDGLLLDGTGDYAEIPYSRTIDPGAGDFTISTRFRYSSTAASPNQAVFWGYGVGADVPQIWLRLQPGSDQVAAWVEGKDGHAYVTLPDPGASFAFGDNVWHQLTLTRTGSRVDVTVDGLSASGIGVAGAVSGGVTGLRLGAKPDGSDAFNGRLGSFELARQGVPGVRLAFKMVDGAVVPARTPAPITDDMSGHCAPGRLLGGRQNPVAGRASNSVALPVNSSHPGVETPFSPTLDLGSGDFTFAAWFRYSGTTNQALVWAYGTTSGKRSLWVRAQPGQDRLFAWVETDTGQVSVPLVDTTSRVAFGDNAWHLLALTRTGDRVELSVDGGTPAAATGLTGSVSADQADAIKGLRLGSKMDGSDVMQGALDDFRLYRRALSGAELSQAATGRFPADLPALYWPFEGQYTQAHDVVQPITGPQTSDASVHCAHAAVSGNPDVVPGKVGNAVRFDGADDSVYMPYKPSIALGANDFKVSTWLRYTGATDQVVFWAYGVGATERSLWMRAQPSKDRLLAYLQTDAGAFPVAAGDATAAAGFNDNQWHFVELQRKAGALTLTVDGHQLGSSTVSGSATYGDTFTVDGFRLGARPDGTERLTGTLDEFTIHRGAALAAHLPLDAAS